MAVGGRGRRPRGAAADWWRELAPVQFSEVDYEDEGVSHERLALWPIPPSRWIVRSPDGDEWAEALDGADPPEAPTPQNLSGFSRACSMANFKALR
jgi:hypothetical protein